MEDPMVGIAEQQDVVAETLLNMTRAQGKVSPARWQ